MEGLRAKSRKKRPARQKPRRKKEASDVIQEESTKATGGGGGLPIDSKEVEDFEYATRKLFEISKKLGVAPEALLSQLDSVEEMGRRSSDDRSSLA